jgi:ferredoxin
MSAIYWFSGTGNSLYTARKLSDELGGVPLYPMPLGAPEEEVGGEGGKVGFVFPSYYGNLPRVVRAFVEDLRVKPGTYIFAVVTMGGSPGAATANLKSALEVKGLGLDYGVCVRMAANYIMKYDPGVMGILAPGLSSTDKVLARAALEISKGVRKVRLSTITSTRLYDDIESLDKGFSTDDTCIACGLCAKICPVRNISLEGGRPKWQGRCEHCAACISWCPAKAVQYGGKTRKRKRYHNPQIKAADLMMEGRA